ncbi:MAG TPA: chromosome segregation protein SMC [Rhodocyclaceae bacterium]|nr:chromosome segregation protein SMC [Rhodocyclaceae bacterium]
MRLTKLKLAGFKSFVDPTTVLMPGQLVGVVGPNGCGKSNIIDAVRWVLGESKAAALRGESMQDVIFNGSTARKPVGRASVELVFDNHQGRAAGQWSQYAEIAVKRVLERNGESTYTINAVHVRRRDVVDLFLGTGLGPRAYAIIEQGMISRIIEAKPEDLRLFLEEAAGVSKYRERRKETESRLSDARENLSRVEDIRGELEQQIARLEGQAEVAQQYRSLQSDLAGRQNLLWLLKRNDARAERDKVARDVERTTNRLEAETASLRELERLAEQARSEHYAAGDALHAAQTVMYESNAEVARLEQELARLRQLKEKLAARLAQLDGEAEHWAAQLETLERDRRRWSELLDNARERVAQSRLRHEAAAARLPQAEHAVSEAEAAAGAVRRELAQAEQQVRVEETHRTAAQRALEAIGQRRERLDRERAELQAPDAGLLEAAQRTHAELEAQLASRQGELATLQAKLPELQAAARAATEQERAALKRLTESRARRDALVQLQQKVQQNDKLGDWLKRHGLDREAPLWQSIEVEQGWETALEAVLRERLSALPLAGPEALAAVLGQPAPATVFLGLGSDTPAAAHPPGADGPRLLDRVRCADPRWQAALADWLAGVRVADDLGTQLARRTEFDAAELWVDRTGQTAGRHGLTLYAPDARTHGVIERQREIHELGEALARLERELEAARRATQEAEAAAARHQEQLAAARRDVQDLQQRRHGAHVELLKLNQAQQRYLERLAQIERDLAEIEHLRAQESDRQARAEKEIARHGELVQVMRGRLEAALETQRQADVALREARASEQAAAREMQEAGFSERECAGKIEDIARSLELALGQRGRVDADLAAAREERGGLDEAAVDDSLRLALDGRGEREAGLTRAREALEEIAANLRRYEESRLKTEQALGPLRDRIGDLRLKEQAAQLAEEQFAQRLAEGEADEAALAPLLTRETKEPYLQAEIARIQQAIEDLGAVNLAALEELTSARERKGFLDAQSADLNEAITTLEDAIRRIDRETREQLRGTFDQVNRHFGLLFPQLFGGGEARLVLTGEEILDSGVQVIAQPPGKKNTSIHLLSGGEKALTAISLVFSLFQLNPAPFCLLDEVDAPLDDTNTERFCDMVRRMSEQTQFLFISHNKITMEMAQQLVGVTMQEQGVSRVVEVDIEEALRMRQEAAA